MYNNSNCLGLIVPKGGEKAIRGRDMGEVLELKLKSEGDNEKI